MTDRNKRIFLSDIHISHIPKISPDKHDYTWLRQGEAVAFTNFLNHLNTREDVEEVIFIGDLFDNWVIPVEIEPPSIGEIITSRIKSKDPVMQALIDLCQNPDIRVVCIPGNHDQDLTKDMVDTFNKDTSKGKKQTRMIFGGTNAWNSGSSVYRSSRLLAEHGSAHAMFNAPDPCNNPGSRLPMGYFISRVVATRYHNTKQGDRHWWTYADDLLESVGPDKFASCVFESLMEEAHLPINRTVFHMPKQNGKAVTVDALQIKARYENLYTQWKERVGTGLAFKSILAEIGYLDDAADRLCKKNDTNIVIFGHSHDWVLDKDSWFVKDRIYANCGTWCDSENNKPYTYVEVETLRGKNERAVLIQEWLGKKPGETLKSESVNL